MLYFTNQCESCTVSGVLRCTGSISVTTLVICITEALVLDAICTLQYKVFLVHDERRYGQV